MIYRFAQFELDETLYQLRRDGEPLDLQPKVFDLLLFLVRNRARVVSKDELFERVWEGVIVNEEALTRAVHAARAAVGDDGERQRVIRTVRRRGFRFVAEVEERSPAESARPEAPDRAEAPAARADFFGREKILAELEAALGDALAGRGRIVLLGGDAGIGKTRTTEELAHTAAARGAVTLTGWCYEGEGAPPYWPWTQVLRAAVERSEVEALRSELEGVAADVAQIVPQVRERLPDLPEPSARPAEQMRFHLFESITTFLRKAAAREPLVVVLDDLHWADSASLRVLEFLAREVGGSRLLVVGTYRDAELRPGEALTATLAELARHALCDRLVLSGLCVDEVSGLLTSVSGSTPPLALVEALTERTGGNPFMIKEIVGLLRAEGRLGALAGSDASKLRIPPTVKEVVRRRLSRLSEPSRRVLRVGAVVGQEFDLDLLQRVGPEPPEPQLEWLEEASEARMIAESPSGLGRYQFEHALLRETLYEDLSLARRIELHRRVGEVLEERHAGGLEPHLTELAHHFLEAVPGGGDASKALRYAMLASERAERLFAWREVMGQTQRALALLETLPEGPKHARSEQILLQRRVRSLIAQHGYASSEVETLSRRLVAIAEQLGDGQALRLARFALFGFYVTQAEYEKADELADWVVQESEQARDAEAVVTAGYFKGLLLFVLGRFSEAREFLERAASLCPLDHGASRFSEMALIQDPDVSALTNLACVLACLGSPEQALRRSDEAILLAEKIGNPFSLAYAQGFGTIARQLLADTRQVRDLSQALLAVATERGVALFRAVARLLEAWARVAAGDAEGGIAALEQGLSDLAATGNQYGATYLLGVTADAYGRAGRPRDALALVKSAQERVRKSGEALYEAELLRLEGELRLQASSEDAARAEACFAQALETARRQQAKLFELRAATSLAGLWRSQRKKARARKLLAEVYERFSEGFDSPDLREARALLDELA